MNHQERLQSLTESYLGSLISEVSGSMSSDLDSMAPFGELGIDSFSVLKIIRKLEADFGTLPKSLLFEYFTISELATYFASKHEQTLTAKFAEELQRSNGFAHADRRKLQPVEVPAATKPPVPVELVPSLKTQLLYAYWEKMPALILNCSRLCKRFIGNIRGKAASPAGRDI